MPRKEEELDEDILAEILEETSHISTEKVRKKYLEKTDRESLSHKTVRRNLRKSERFDSNSPEENQPEIWWVDN